MTYPEAAEEYPLEGTPRPWYGLPEETEDEPVPDTQEDEPDNSDEDDLEDAETEDPT